jgi:hypothetical protein
MCKLSLRRRNDNGALVLRLRLNVEGIKLSLDNNSCRWSGLRSLCWITNVSVKSFKPFGADRFHLALIL